MRLQLRRGVATASFGGGHRLSDDRWVQAERRDETGQKLAVIFGAARAANLSPETFTAKLEVWADVA